MAVTKISEYESREIIHALQDLLERAIAGRVKGFAFSIKTASKRHRIGFTGDYWRDPTEALGVITRMEYKANQLISALEDEPETGHAPL